MSNGSTRKRSELASSAEHPIVTDSALASAILTEMSGRLRKPYRDYLDELARAGIIDHVLNNAILEGKTVEEHIVEVLHAAGRLPEGWDSQPDAVRQKSQETRRVG